MQKHTEEKKVLVVLGSPRKKGNSASIAEKIINGAESAGAITETVFLHGLDISPCQACYACQKKTARGVPSTMICNPSIPS